MHLSWTLSQYIARHFLLSILLALAGLSAITSMVDIVELLRRASGKQDVPLSAIIQLTFLRLPFMAEKLMPYAVLIGSMIALSKLTRSHELIIARAAGISVWQFLAPAMALVLTIGLFVSTIFNPISSALLMRFEQLEGKHFKGTASIMSISPSGLWLRQIEHDNDQIGEHIIYTARIAQRTMEFSNIIVFTFNPEHVFTSRLDAKRAVLEEGVLRLSGVVRSIPGKPAENIEKFNLPTTLTFNYIQDSFAPPESLSFWSLPNFIQMLEDAGFSALRHKLYWHSLLASPFLMMGTVLIAAVFSLRIPRRGRLGLLMVLGILAGFIIHFLTDIVFAFGSAGTLPVVLAAWAPSIIVVMIGAALLLQLEDG